MNEKHPVDSLMQSTMENLRNMIDVNTVIGDPITTADGTSIIPISKVTFGFASGGSEFQPKDYKNNNDSSLPFGGGSGAGVTVKPIAFLVVKDTFVKLIPVEGTTSCDRILDSLPQLMDNIKSLFINKTNTNTDDTSSKTKLTVDSDDDLNITIESDNYNKEL